jgi:ATP-dependent Clp protease protease subunit
MSATNQPASTPEAYVVFCGPINEENSKKLTDCLTTATAKNQNIHLLFQSSGGSVGDGICLYNFFKTLPVELTVYNVGSVCSIAVIAYLGARHRVASPRAVFMIHRTTTNLTHAPAVMMKGVAKSLILDDERIESILRESVTLAGEETWSNFVLYFCVWFPSVDLLQLVLRLVTVSALTGIAFLVAQTPRCPQTGGVYCGKFGLFHKEMQSWL